MLLFRLKRYIKISLVKSYLDNDETINKSKSCHKYINLLELRSIDYKIYYLEYAYCEILQHNKNQICHQKIFTYIRTDYQITIKQQLNYVRPKDQFRLYKNSRDCLLFHNRIGIFNLFDRTRSLIYVYKWFEMINQQFNTIFEDIDGVVLYENNKYITCSIDDEFDHNDGTVEYKEMLNIHIRIREASLDSVNSTFSDEELA